MNLVFSFLLLFFILSIVPSKSEKPALYSCPGNNKTDGDPQISNNIEDLLAKLVANTTKNGFNAVSTGKNETRINGLAQCRADVSTDDCSNCLGNASVVIRSSAYCPNQSEAIIVYHHCLLRYSTKEFYGVVDTSLNVVYYNTANVPGNITDVFNKKLEILMDNITAQAVQPDQKYLGKGNRKLAPFFTLYTLVQCTRDLSALGCRQCLDQAKLNLPTTCHNKQGCLVVYSSCYLRYELYSFFDQLDLKGSLVGNYESAVAVKP